jgi:hypothetical protein
MKTPKEKAQDLVDRYYWTFGDGYLGEQHIQCALIAVDEILNNFGLRTNGQNFYTEYSAVEYWQEVKKEIELL